MSATSGGSVQPYSNVLVRSSTLDASLPRSAKFYFIARTPIKFRNYESSDIDLGSVNWSSYLNGLVCTIEFEPKFLGQDGQIEFVFENEDGDALTSVVEIVDFSKE